ncbi:Chaperone SurA [Bienertia sinuspersici]
MDSLEIAMSKFKLTEEEEEVLDMEEVQSEDMQPQIELCLVGKLVTISIFNVEAMKSVMKNAWKPQEKNFMVREMGKNLFIFHFFAAADRKQVLDSGPWAFDDHLMVLRPMEGDEQPENLEFSYADFWVRVYNMPMEKRSKEGAMWLGGSLGALLEYDDSDLSGWTKSMRIRVRINIHKPLGRGKKVVIKGECEGFDKELAESDYPYGPWLLASPLKRRVRVNTKEREEENRMITELKETLKTKRRLSFVEDDNMQGEKGNVGKGNEGGICHVNGGKKEGMNVGAVRGGSKK